MAGKIEGRTGWSVRRTDNGHRNYSVKHKIETTDEEDGPAIVLSTVGLPTVGSVWGYGNDLDSWAFCLPEAEVKFLGKQEASCWWEVTNHFSTEPQERCQTTEIENPLDEPDRVGGSFTKLKKQAKVDRNDKPIANSSHELFTGSATEVDDSRPTVLIGKNVSSLPLVTFASMIDTVNDATLWGMAARTIKLTNVNWQRKLYGVCTYYYIVEYEFEINANTFDKTLLDIGTRVLKGKWVDNSWVGLDPDEVPTENNPKNLKNSQIASNFIQYKDETGQFGGDGKVLLDGKGRPLQDPNDDAITLGPFEYYPESNFLLLNIPTSL